MAAATTWAPSGLNRYGLSPDAPTTTAQSELHAVASPGVGDAAAGQLLNPENPLLWFGVIAAITLGLAAFSTSVRVGPAKAALSLGK
ncbi:MAG: hypothetical protein BGO38_07920 [Cellulomonas sp. 73-145]|uniref:hypothetical protein n=1 Tax=Cellulomonas sp. 73-145 TaxID=1895739 RepID=UPI00092A24B1|nr:hypothetical protein [Cellulomonas sp. 73-145]MBN9326218.1 hypothetical protein [Cellulomonas sp.]OJV58119.1 MAG: hypothetical protein BGO38_07920 [Cellulomonas sp. 73-145]